MSADAGAVRRTQFREAVARLSQRSLGADLARSVVLPAAVALVAGFAFIILAWWGAAHSFREIEQIPYLISGGFLGLGLVFVGGLMLAAAVIVSVMRQFEAEAEQRAARQMEALVERLRVDADGRPTADGANGNGAAVREPARRRTARRA